MYIVDFIVIVVVIVAVASTCGNANNCSLTACGCLQQNQVAHYWRAVGDFPQPFEEQITDGSAHASVYVWLGVYMYVCEPQLFTCIVEARVANLTCTPLGHILVNWWCLWEFVKMLHCHCCTCTWSPCIHRYYCVSSNEPIIASSLWSSDCIDI